MTHCASNTSRSLNSSARLRILLGIVFTRDPTENVLTEIFPVWSPSPSLKAPRQYRFLRKGSLVSGHWTSPGSGIDAIQGLPVRSNTIGPLRRWTHVLMSLSPVETPIPICSIMQIIDFNYTPQAKHSLTQLGPHPFPGTDRKRRLRKQVFASLLPISSRRRNG